MARKLYSYVWLASPAKSWARATPRLSAANTRRNRPRPNLAAITWPLDSCASTCAGAFPVRPTSRTGCSTCPSKQDAEFTHERTAEYVEVR